MKDKNFLCGKDYCLYRHAVFAKTECYECFNNPVKRDENGMAIGYFQRYRR